MTNIPIVTMHYVAPWGGRRLPRLPCPERAVTNTTFDMEEEKPQSKLSDVKYFASFSESLGDASWLTYIRP